MLYKGELNERLSKLGDRLNYAVMPCNQDFIDNFDRTSFNKEMDLIICALRDVK